MAIAPKQLFLIDALGACLSAFCLGIIIPSLENFFGMPRTILYLLAVIPCFFAVYSFICFLKFPERWPLFLKGIAFANILYCILSIAMMVYFRELLTVYDWIYFILEIIIVGIVVRFELKAAHYS